MWAALTHTLARPWTRWLGLRYLRSKQRSGFLSFITWISILGVAVGVTAMIVVLSVMEGFEKELWKRLMGSDVHIAVAPTRTVSGFDRGYVPELATFPAIAGVMEASPIVATEVVLRAGRRVAGVALKGVSEERLAQLRAKVTETTDERLLTEQVRVGGVLRAVRLPRLLLGQELAYEIGVMPGDRVLVVSPTETEGPFSSVPRVKQFVVEGIYRSGLAEQELQTAYADAASVRSFLRRTGVVSGYEVSVREFARAPEVAALLRSSLPGYRVQDWRELNAQLFASLRLERIAMFVMLAFIVVVASFNIVTTLSLMVIEKKRDIAILRAMGARTAHVAAVFLSEGLLIGVVGIALGCVLGFGVSVALQHYEIIQLPDIYYDRTLPVSINGLYYVLIPSCAALIVLVSCLYPAQRAAQLNPLDGIRGG